MSRQRIVFALVTSALVAACGSSATPGPSTVTAAGPSVSAPAPSVAPPLSVAPSVAPVAPTPTPSVAATPAPTPVPWTTYTSTRFHYKMEYPPEWVVTPGSAKVSDQFDNFGYPYIYVTRDVISVPVSISVSVTGEIASIKSHYHAKLISNQGIKLASGYAGRLLTFSATNDGLKIVIKDIVVAKGKVGYFLTMFGDAETAVADRTLFRKMYLTWRPTP